MQLHRHYTTDLMSFTLGLEKLGRAITPKSLYSQEQANQRFEDLKKSTDPHAAAKAFSKGFGVSFIMPLAIGIGYNTPLNPTKIKKGLQASERQLYLAKGLQQGGTSPEAAKELAVIIDNASSALRTSSGNVYKQVKDSVQGIIKQELTGAIPQNFTKGYEKGWTITPSANKDLNNVLKSTFIDNPSARKNLSNESTVRKLTSLETQIAMTNPKGSPKELTQKIFATNVVEPTSEAILRDRLPNIINKSKEMFGSDSYSRLYDLGEEAVRREGTYKPLSNKNINRRIIGNILRSLPKAAKLPAIVGLIGGGAALRKSYKNKQKYRTLQEKARRLNAGR